MYARILLTAWASIMTITFFVYAFAPRPEVVDEEKEAAFQECLEEVKNNCGSVISYAIALEIENSRLNKVLKETKDNCSGVKSDR